MKINNINIHRIMQAYKVNEYKVRDNEKTIQGKDKIEISEKARDFQVAMQAFQKLPEIREEKIKEISNAIKNGTYRPTAKEVAEKMLERIKPRF